MSLNRKPEQAEDVVEGNSNIAQGELERVLQRVPPLHQSLYVRVIHPVPVEVRQCSETGLLRERIPGPDLHHGRLAYRPLSQPSELCHPFKTTMPLKRVPNLYEMYSNDQQQKHINGICK